MVLYKTNIGVLFSTKTKAIYFFFTAIPTKTTYNEQFYLPKNPENRANLTCVTTKRVQANL